jgi:hypothetical protein
MELKAKTVILPQDAKKGDVLVLTDPPHLIPAAIARRMFCLKATGEEKAPMVVTPKHIVEQQKIKLLQILSKAPDGLSPQRLLKLSGISPGKEGGTAIIHNRLAPMRQLGRVERTGPKGKTIYILTTEGLRYVDALPAGEQQGVKRLGRGG